MRDLIGTIALLAFIPIYIAAILWLAAQFIDGTNVLIQTVFYLAAGVVWTWPAKTIILWMKKPR